MRKFAMILVALMGAHVESQATEYWLFSSPANMPTINNLQNWGAVDNLELYTFSLGGMTAIPAAGLDNFTGIAIPASIASSYQRSSSSITLGASAIQAYGQYFGYLVNSATSPYPNSRPAPLYTANAQVNFSGQIKPWGGMYGAQSELCHAFFAAIPYVSWTPGAAIYGGAAFVLQQEGTLNQISVGPSYFDNRPWQLIEQQGIDVETSIAWVSSFYGSQNLISTPEASTGSMTSTWTDDRWFSFCIDNANMNKIIAFANDKLSAENKPLFSTDLSKWYLNFSVIGAEIGTDGSNSMNGAIGARFKEWNIFIRGQ